MTAGKTLRFHQSAPRLAPKNLQAVLFATETSVDLNLTVTEMSGITGYGFAYGGAPVPMVNGSGVIHAQPGDKKLLQWVMLGDPGSTMHVTVKMGGQTLAERKKSKIPGPQPKAYDALEIAVP